MGVVLTVTDVICGMELDEKTVKYTSTFGGKTYYFCGPMCKLEFDSNPKKYAENASSS